jgi:hypothetical protein
MTAERTPRQQLDQANTEFSAELGAPAVTGG